ncbi:MAG: hypothetical protein AB1749_10860 [Pseudomonadota bacterium]
MTTTKIIVATAIAAVLSAQGAVSLRAEELRAVQTMKPLHGISFDIGSKRAVSYYLSDKGRCKLVLTLATVPNWDEVPSFTSTRFEAAIPGGKATRFVSDEGKSVEFSCQENAQAMSVNPVENVAGAGAPR